MEIKEIKLDKVKIIFWALFLIIFWLFVFALSAKMQAEAKIENFKKELWILEENKKLSKNWQELESAIIEKRDLIENQKMQLELLEKNKYEVEAKIQENRKIFFKNNSENTENVK